MHVLVGQVGEALLDHGIHAGEDAALDRVALAQQPGQGVMGPALAPELGGGDLRGHHPLDHGPFQVAGVVHRHEGIPRRVAFATVPQPIHQVAATIPVAALGRIGFEGAVLMGHHVPEQQAGAHVEGEADLVVTVRGGGRFGLHEVGVERLHVLIRDQVIGGVGHGGIEAAIGGAAVVHHLIKILIAVAAYPLGLVGADVGGVDDAERRLERQSTGILLATLGGVAGGAVADLGQVFSLCHLRILGVGRRHRACAEQECECESGEHHVRTTPSEINMALTPS
ncbi:hypothetical protein D3C79_730420 [compost metagenome]